MDNRELVAKLIEKTKRQSESDVHREPFSWPYVCAVLEHFLVDAMNGVDVRDEIETIVERWPEK